MSLIIQPVKIGPVGVPETSAPNYFPTLRNIPETRIFHSYLGVSLQSHIAHVSVSRRPSVNETRHRQGLISY
jgi:hypothetical protein